MKVFYEHKIQSEGTGQQRQIAELLLSQCEAMKNDLNITHKDYQADINAISTGIYWLQMALNNSATEAAAQLWLETRNLVRDSNN